MLPEVVAQIKQQVGDTGFSDGQYEQASQLFTRLVTGEAFTEFLTLPAYEILN
jgi:malate synthase